MTTVSVAKAVARARGDIVEGFSRWRLWGLLGWKDIRQRYRRTVLGPFWLTANMAIFIGAIGFLYSRIFDSELAVYVPFLTSGFIAWTLIVNFLIDASKSLVLAEHVIKLRRLPLSLFVYRTIWRHLLIMAHNLIVFVVVAVVFGIVPNLATLLIVPALLLSVINAAWIGLVLATLSARFRDVEQFVGAVMQILFFVTPIFWKPDLLGDRIVFANINPLYHFVELIRAPLLGTSPELLTWTVAIGTALVGWMATLWFYGRLRPAIPYWL